MGSIALSPEQNGGGAPIGRMATDMLVRILEFVKVQEEKGKKVYLGASGVPFSLDGGGDGSEELLVDTGKISEVLESRATQLEQEQG